MTKNRQKAVSLIQGGYNLHTHSFPSHSRRSLDDFELVKQYEGIR